MSDAMQVLLAFALVLALIFAAPIIALLREESCETRCATQYGIKPEQENID